MLVDAMPLMTDVFGNYVAQKMFEYGTTAQRTQMVERMEGQVLELSLHMYGCRVVQKALESVSDDEQVCLLCQLAKATVVVIFARNTFVFIAMLASNIGSDFALNTFVRFLQVSLFMAPCLCLFTCMLDFPMLNIASFAYPPPASLGDLLLFVPLPYILQIKIIQELEGQVLRCVKDQVRDKGHFFGSRITNLLVSTRLAVLFALLIYSNIRLFQAPLPWRGFSVY